MGNQGANREKNSQKNLVTQSWGLGTSREEKGTHTGEKEQGQAGGALGGSITGCTQGQDSEGWGDSRDPTTAAQGNTHKRKAPLQIPSDVIKASWLNPAQHKGN